MSSTNGGLQPDLLVDVLEHRTTAREILRSRRNFQPGVQPGRVSYVGIVSVCASRRHARTNKSKNVKVFGLECRVACSRRPRSAVNAFLRLTRRQLRHSADESKNCRPFSFIPPFNRCCLCRYTERQRRKATIIWHCMKLNLMEMFALAVNLFITTRPSTRLIVALY